MIGLVLGAARAHRIPVVSQFTAVYVEIIRNTPILVQIFMLFFALPQAGIRLDAFTVAWLSVTLWGGGSTARTSARASRQCRSGRASWPTRSALPARHVPQRDASDRRAHRPALVDQHLHLRGEEHSLVYVIGYPELTTTAINIANLTLETLEALTVLGIVYLTLVWSLSASIRLLESRLALPEARR